MMALARPGPLPPLSVAPSENANLNCVGCGTVCRQVNRRGSHRVFSVQQQLLDGPEDSHFLGEEQEI